MKPSAFRYGSEYGNEYEPYARPESNMGFVMNGHPIDPMDEYVHQNYGGHAVDEYGRPIIIDQYDDYPNHYLGGGQMMDDEDDYNYGYHHQGMR